MSLSKDDVVVLNVDATLSQDILGRYKAALKDVLGGDVKVIVLGKGMRLGVLGKGPLHGGNDEQIDERIDLSTLAKQAKSFVKPTSPSAEIEP